MATVEATGKTVEEAVAAALLTLGATAEEVTYEVLEQPSGGIFGFFSKPAKVAVTKIEKTIIESAAAPIKEEAITSQTPIEAGKEFLKKIFANMNLVVEIDQIDKEEIVLFDLKGKDLGILIGRHGQTLDALQYLTNLAANKNAGEDRVRIVLDVEDYRKRREETLCRLAQRLASKVKRRGQRIVLEPMSRHERKIIHMALQDDPKIATYSEGDEPYRKIVITAKK